MKTLKALSLRLIAAPALAFGLTGFGICGIAPALIAAGLCVYLADCIEDSK
jgi:hypothetical protein